MAYQNRLNNLFNLPSKVGRLSFKDELEPVRPVPTSKGKSRRSRLEESFGDEDSEDDSEEDQNTNQQHTQPTTPPGATSKNSNSPNFSHFRHESQIAKQG